MHLPMKTVFGRPIAEGAAPLIELSAEKPRNLIGIQFADSPANFCDLQRLK
jgi:hypothetical protein